MWRKMVVLATFGGLVVGGSAAGRVHTVRRGETLEAIGRTYGVPVPALAAANGVRDPDRIMAGSTLTIPTPGPAPAPIAPTRSTLRPAPAPAVKPAASSRPSAAGTAQKVVPMPAATLAAAKTAPKIVVPADRAGLRIAFVQFSRLAGVPSDLAMALAWQESGWQRNKVSSTNAVGVMQLMPDTVDFVSRQLLGTAPLNPRDPVANIRMGTRFLRYLLDSHGGDVDRALASYYQGLRSVREHGTLDETDRFVANVKALRARF
jgi:soluble lytic murein transglycosylase-like protein